MPWHFGSMDKQGQLVLFYLAVIVCTVDDITSDDINIILNKQFMS